MQSSPLLSISSIYRFRKTFEQEPKERTVKQMMVMEFLKKTMMGGGCDDNGDDNDDAVKY